MDIENNEHLDDIVEDELEVTKDDSFDLIEESEHQDLSQQHESKGESERRKHINALADKVMNGEKTLDDIASNAGSSWAYDSVEQEVNKRISQYEKDEKTNELEKKLAMLESKITEKEKNAEKEHAKQLIREFREARGLSVDDFKKKYPTFQKDFTDLAGKLGTLKAVELSLNTIVASSYHDDNIELRQRMRIPSSYGNNTISSPNVRVPKSAIEAGRSFFGITDSSLYDKYAEEIRSVKIGKDEF